MKKTKKWLFAICALVIILGGGFWLWYAYPHVNKDLLVLHGNVDIRQVDLGFRVGGRIAKTLVEEGTVVEARQPLASLDKDLLTQAKDQAQANYQAQEANLKKLERGYRSEEVAQARAEVAAAAAVETNARENFRRVSALRAKNAVSQRDFDNAQAAMREAQARLKQGRDNLDMLSSGYRDEDIAAQKASTRAAQAAYERARIELDDAILYAPEKGVVLTRAREAGAIVQPGQTVYTLTLTEPVWLRVYALEPSLGLIKPGMPVEIGIDAAPGKRFKGHVGFISPTAEFTPKTVETPDIRTHLVYRVRIVAEDPENMMRQGMPVTVFINLAK